MIRSVSRCIISVCLSAFAIFCNAQTNEFYFNGGADVILKYPPRGSGGRAMVHSDNNILTLNFEGDFSGGTRIGNHFYVNNSGMFRTYNWSPYGAQSDDFFVDVEPGTRILRTRNYNTESPNIEATGIHTGTGYFDGRIGIKTLSPRANLDVAGNIYNQQLGAVLGRLLEGDNVGEGTFLGVRGYGTQWEYQGKSFALEHSFYGQTNSSINFFRGGSFGNGFLTFNTNSNTEQMRLENSGNLAIGTTDSKGYKLAVNGNIRAKEIKVEAANWPDYVFKEDYLLPTLEETEKHIKEKGHLPGVPTAKEAEVNGVYLGEMNKILLQKMEEMTLYIIQLKKENDEIKDKLEKLSVKK